jgi:arylsulfatase A-like enzyme
LCLSPSGDNGPASHDITFFDSQGPFRGYKSSIHEGGVRQSVVVQWPGTIPAGVRSNHIFTFWDLLPTVAELANVTISASDYDGLSAVGAMTPSAHQQDGGASTTRPDSHPIYFEFCWLKVANTPAKIKAGVGIT